MNRSMITATNTMSQLQKQLDMIGNNLANANTTGYKQREISFSELLVQQFNNQSVEENEVARLTPNGIRQGVGAKLGQTRVNVAQGNLQQTGRMLDLAFTKEGQYFQVQVQENGQELTRFTRDGTFYFSPMENGSDQVMLVTSEGFPVLDENENPIIIDQGFKDIKISENGTVTVVPNDQNGLPQQFNLSVVEVQRPQLLESKGGNLLGLPNLEELNIEQQDVLTFMIDDERAQIKLQQGALEQSNVDLTVEMSELLNTQRSYQFNAKSISIADQMMGLVNGIR